VRLKQRAAQKASFPPKQSGKGVFTKPTVNIALRTKSGNTKTTDVENNFWREVAFGRRDHADGHICSLLESLFRVSCFVYRVECLVFGISGLVLSVSESEVSCFGFRVSGFGYHVSCFVFCVSCFVLRVYCPGVRVTCFFFVLFLVLLLALGDRG